MLKISATILFSMAAMMLHCSHVFAWHDQTHLAVSQAAGYEKWYNSTGADVAKIKAKEVEQYNHWYNNNARIEITPEMVLTQIDRYNDETDAEGHLYGAILASLREYETNKASRKYADYNIAFCAHYIGDLTQPLHNTPIKISTKRTILIMMG